MTELANTAATTPPHPGVGLWIKVARPFTLSATISPLLVGTAMAAYQDRFNPWIFLIALFSGLFLQVAANFYNELYDYKYGLDNIQSLGASTVIFQGTMSERQVLAGGIVSFGIATILGIMLILIVGPAIILFGLTGMAIAYFYSARPFKLATRGLGDVMVFLAMGILMVFGAYYVQIQHWSWSVLAASIPIGLLVTAILNMNNIRDYEDDYAVHKQTLVVRFGRHFAKIYHAMLIIGAYVSIIVFVRAHVLPVWGLAAWLSLPTAYMHVRAVLQTTDRKVYMRGMKQISALHLQFGVALALGMSIATLTHFHI